MFIEHFHHIFFICPIALSFVDITLLFFTYVHSVGFLWTLHFCFLYISIHFFFRSLCFCLLWILRFYFLLMSILSVFYGHCTFVFCICLFTSFSGHYASVFGSSTAHCLAMKFQIFQTATNKPPDASRHPGACYVSDDTLLFFYNTLLIFK